MKGARAGDGGDAYSINGGDAYGINIGDAYGIGGGAGSTAQKKAIDPAALRILEFDKVRAILTQKCVSDIGRQHAGELTPSMFIAEIRRDLKQTSDAAQFIMRNGNPPLGGFSDIRGIIKRVELEAVLNPSELLQVTTVLRSVRNMKRFGRSGGSGSGVGGNSDGDAAETGYDDIVAMINSLVENQRLENHINACIISEDELADDASPALSSVRRQIKRMQDTIKDKLSAILRSPAYQKFMQDSLVTMRHDRYVIPVKQEHRTEIKGLVHDMSSSGATVFIEPMAVVEANNEIRELKVKEELEIERILAELTSEVAQMQQGLADDVETLGLLDFLFAKAKLSLDYDCSAPEIGEDARISIKRGRHPLLSRDAVVPIDFWMAEGVNTIVVTGPNTGGKTVALKTVGLLTLMAQAGLHIPADSGSSLRVFSKIFADIGDEQSIEQSLSTFSSHMRNIVRIMDEADDATLALFDEIGAGTDPTEGAAIATAILECLHQIGAATVATTHYSELKLYALTTSGVENACCEFDVATLRPTYKLLIGVPGRSNAFAISGRLGLAPEILARAREFLTDESVAFEDVLQTIGKNREAAEQEFRAAERARIEIEELRDELAKQNASIERQKESVMREAREKARRILTESRYEADEFIKKLKDLESDQDAGRRRRDAQTLRNRMKSKLDGVEATLAFTLPPREGNVRPPDKLKPGDTVEIVNLQQRGTVETPPDGNGNVLIRAGIMSITAHVSNIKLVDEQSSISRNAARLVSAGGGGSGGGGDGSGGGGGNRSVGNGSGNGGNMRGAGGGNSGGGLRALNMRAELDIRGERLEGALSQVDRYLADASATGLNEVAIIHGKGTGALRSGIQDFLRGHPSAKSFRNGNYGEGDMGVTIVTIK